MIALRKGFITLLVTFFLLSACTAPVKPETPLQQVMAAYSTYALAVNSLASMVETGRVSSADARKYGEQLKQVRVALDTSRTLLSDGLPSTDAEALHLMRNAILVLNKISAELAARGGGS